MIRQHLNKAHPERDGAFRWRGDAVSRTEGPSDAVFGAELLAARHAASASPP